MSVVGIGGEPRTRTLHAVHDECCAVACTAEIIGHKWTALILHDLSEGPRRFCELERICPAISPRTLVGRLQLLEAHRVIVRRAFNECPRGSSMS